MSAIKELELIEVSFPETEDQGTGGMAMEDTIKWETEMAAALDRARTENKNILLDFFNPG